MVDRLIPRYGTLAAIGLFGLLGYFTWQFAYSPKGIMELQRLQGLSAQRLAELGRIRGDRIKFETRVAQLRTDSMDPDLLDEMARRQLGVVNENDVILFAKQ